MMGQPREPENADGSPRLAEQRCLRWIAEDA
jgi:hypothetical protein